MLWSWVLGINSVKITPMTPTPGMKCSQGIFLAVLAPKSKGAVPFMSELADTDMKHRMFESVAFALWPAQGARQRASHSALTTFWTATAQTCSITAGSGNCDHSSLPSILCKHTANKRECVDGGFLLLGGKTPPFQGSRIKQLHYRSRDEARKSNKK